MTVCLVGLGRLLDLQSLPCPGRPGPEMTLVISQSKKGALIRMGLSVFAAGCLLPESFQSRWPTRPEVKGGL